MLGSTDAMQCQGGLDILHQVNLAPRTFLHLRKGINVAL